MDWRYGNTPAQVFSSIAEGRAEGMPAWGTQLPEDQRTHVRSTPDADLLALRDSRRFCGKTLAEVFGR